MWVVEHDNLLVDMVSENCLWPFFCYTADIFDGMQP